MHNNKDEKKTEALVAGAEWLRAASYASGGNEFLVRVLIGNWSIKTVLQILTHTHTHSVHTHTAEGLACIRMQRGANINKIFISFMHLLLSALYAAQLQPQQQEGERQPRLRLQAAVESPSFLA